MPTARKSKPTSKTFRVGPEITSRITPFGLSLSKPLKSGCRIEALQHQTAERLKRAIGINMVIAWRIMLMTLLGRQCPELPAEVLFSDLGIRVLEAYKKSGIARPTRLGNAVLLEARLGGHIGRPSDPPPGHQVMWLGCMERSRRGRCCGDRRPSPQPSR